MKITRIGFRNFRSIGTEPVILDLTKKVNVLIGPNNAGKSTVIAACQRWTKDRFAWGTLSETDRHKRTGPSEAGFVIEGDWKGLDGEKSWPDNCTGMFDLPGTGKPFQATPFDNMPYRAFHQHYEQLTSSYYKSEPNRSEVLKAIQEAAHRVLNRLSTVIPTVLTVPVFRRITDGDYAIHGSGIVKLLAHWKNPDIGKEADSVKFAAVENFLQHLIEMPSAELEIPPENPQIIVNRNDVRLPLENYGTGLHQLIILAIVVLQHDRKLIAIEEPEIHLHPRLQRELLRFLIEQTKNNYLISTHSPAFLSRPTDCHIVRIWLEDDVTRSKAVKTTAVALEVLKDLGASAADLMQSRFVIWVEGPSDAVYVRRWLELAYQEEISPQQLLEDIDYSIVFYGGRCLSHLSVERESELKEEKNDPEALKLIQLLRINQNAAVIIDSDRTPAKRDLNATKQRIVEECSKSEVRCWVTAGREVENYIPKAAVAKAYHEHTGIQLTLSFGSSQKLEQQLERAIGKGRIVSSLQYDRDKPSWARRIVPHIESLDGSDLRERITELVNAICAAH